MSFPGNLLDNLADESTDPPFDPTCIKLEPTLSLVPDGYPMEENLLRKKKSKKGPAPKLFGNERCKICDSKATGFHYNVLSCEACKNFFRRAVVHNLAYECKTGNEDCSVLAGHRPRCQYCRMQKCRLMGMKNEYINRVGRTRSTKLIVKTRKEPIFEISEPYRSIIDGIIFGWEGMENITEDTSSLDINANLDPTIAFDFFTQMATVKVKKIIYFCKHIPMWDEMKETIQICLIKGGLTEAMVLYNTADYDLTHQKVKFIDGKFRSKEAFYTCGYNPDIVEAIFGIWEYCHKNKISDVASVALLAAAAITSPDRTALYGQPLEDRQKMDYLHTNIITALQNHLIKSTSESALTFARAFSVLVNLRDVSDSLMPKQLDQFSMLGLPMTPLFAELYNSVGNDDIGEASKL